MNRLIIWGKLLYWYILSLKCNKNAKLLSIEETVDKVCDRGCSVIRLGDGELNCIEGIDVHYQKANEKLKQEMLELIKMYVNDSKQCTYLLCMPNEFLKCNGIVLAKKRVWVSSWARFRFYFKKNFDISCEYGDAFLFAKGYSTIYERIWQNKETVIFVHNDKKYADYFKEKYKKKVFFVKVPPINCYDQIDPIIEKIKNKASLIEKREKAIVLISAGPCAKAIVFRLEDLRIQIIDTGHCWDDPLNTKGDKK